LRKGGFEISKDPGASRDRDLVGNIRRRLGKDRGEIRTDDLDFATVERIKAFGGKPDYAHGNYQLVRRTREGKGKIARYCLIDEGGRWGYAVPRYNGRNYHFYCALQAAGYEFEDDYADWDRRFCFDSWEYYFDWESEILIPLNYREMGVYYFEPCYAFTYTFNHGYEHGYYAGYMTGVEDWNAGRPYDSFIECYWGYDPCLGPYFEYTDGYNQGFIQGYFAGYCGYTYGWDNFGFGDFGDYPIIYDFDYDYIPQGEECLESEPREPN